MKKNIFIISLSVIFFSLAASSYVLRKPQTLEGFISSEAKKRFPHVNIVGNNKIELTKKMAQEFREKLLKQTIVNEELKKDPSLYFKAEEGLKQKGILLADAIVNGIKMKFLIPEAKACKLVANQTLIIKSKADLTKICNTEFETLFSQLKAIDITIQTNAFSVAPDDVAMDWQALVDESMQTLALNAAFKKSLKESWL